MEIVGARGAASSAEDRLAVVRRLGGDLQILDARFVCGRDHLVSAAEHAERAMREGMNVAKSLAVEFVLCASGERQIAEALTKMGIRDETTEFAVVLLGGGDAAAVLHALGLTRDDAVLASSRQKLAAFGITDVEIGSLSEEQAADLVLERVALVDVLK